MKYKNCWLWWEKSAEHEYLVGQQKASPICESMEHGVFGYITQNNIIVKFAQADWGKDNKLQYDIYVSNGEITEVYFRPISDILAKANPYRSYVIWTMALKVLNILIN